MRADDLRRAFTEFFAQRDHEVVASASLIPHDPSLLFTVAGMVPFKPYFVGDEAPPYRRATSVQKCVRAGGKQNDLDEVGRTSRHLTFFEMLGNFSFGDYFKDQAIPMAWEFVTDVLGLDPDRLWVTVHTSDDDAADIWVDSVGYPRDRIQRFDEDNFWKMGDTGPCGPCSEIFYDKGEEHGPGGGPAGGAEDRYVEIWNLVFMQYDTQPDGSRVPLPKPSIDTGAGLERMLGVLQGVDSVFDLEEMRALISVAERATGVRYGEDDRSDVSLRIIADHARSLTHLMTDGVVPSNEDRGYVLRMIIRRAVRHAYLLGLEEGAIAVPMVDAVVDQMGGAYPDLHRQRDLVADAVDREEGRFRQTLRTGMAILDEELAALDGGPLSGDVAFTLHDTHGFPVELTVEIAGERGVEVDQEGFDAAMDRQRARARSARQTDVGEDRSDAYRTVLEQHGTTAFLGYEETESDVTVTAVLPVGDDQVEIFLDRTPFYAEAGGQVGDTGTITSETGTARVLDTTYALTDLPRHHAEIVEGSIEAGQSARATVDGGRRDAIRRHHTGTHLLHWALREVLGDHVKQAGSIVLPDRLRFDFSHHSALTPDEIAKIEAVANQEVLSNAPVRTEVASKREADERGVIAFFGDKYGDTVRILHAGDHSMELCGGTHVRALGDIGPIKVVSEGSIGANTRRIEAVTGQQALEHIASEEAALRELAGTLGVATDDVVPAFGRRLDEIRSLRDEVKALRAQLASGEADQLAAEAVDGVVVARRDGLDQKALRDLAVKVRDNRAVRAVVLGGVPDAEASKVALVAAVSPESGFVASDLLTDAARTVGGGGGRGDELANAGGREPGQLDEALDQVRAAAGIGG